MENSVDDEIDINISIPEFCKYYYWTAKHQSALQNTLSQYIGTDFDLNVLLMIVSYLEDELSQISRKYPINILSSTTYGCNNVRIHIGLIGDSKCGKTQILNCFMKKSFEQKHLSTIGIDMETSHIHLFESKRLYRYKLLITDNSGQERFASITSSYWEKSKIHLLCFDLTNIASFKWIQQYGYPRLIENIKCYHRREKSDQLKINKWFNPCVLVGCKDDIFPYHVNSEDIDAFCRDKNMVYISCSSKLNRNIQKLFELAVTERLMYSVYHSVNVYQF